MREDDERRVLRERCDLRLEPRELRVANREIGVAVAEAQLAQTAVEIAVVRRGRDEADIGEAGQGELRRGAYTGGKVQSRHKD